MDVPARERTSSRRRPEPTGSRTPRTSAGRTGSGSPSCARPTASPARSTAPTSTPTTAPSAPPPSTPGKIKAADGGTVTVEIRPGEDSYAASTRNGVTSLEFGSWFGSFVIVGGHSGRRRLRREDGRRRAGTAEADDHRGHNGTRYLYVCPSGGTVSVRLWGTNVYTDDSSVCTAAAQVGVITPAARRQRHDRAPGGPEELRRLQGTTASRRATTAPGPEASSSPARRRSPAARAAAAAAVAAAARRRPLAARPRLRRRPRRRARSP